MHLLTPAQHTQADCHIALSERVMAARKCRGTFAQTRSAKRLHGAGDRRDAQLAVGEHPLLRR